MYVCRVVVGEAGAEEAVVGVTGMAPDASLTAMAKHTQPTVNVQWVFVKEVM